MKLCIDLQQYLDARPQCLTSRTFEIGTDEYPFRSPTSGIGLGDGCGATLVFLDE